MKAIVPIAAAAERLELDQESFLGAWAYRQLPVYVEVPPGSTVYTMGAQLLGASAPSCVWPPQKFVASRVDDVRFLQVSWIDFHEVVVAGFANVRSFTGGLRVTRGEVTSELTKVEPRPLRKYRPSHGIDPAIDPLFVRFVVCSRDRPVETHDVTSDAAKWLKVQIDGALVRSADIDALVTELSSGHAAVEESLDDVSHALQELDKISLIVRNADPQKLRNERHKFEDRIRSALTVTRRHTFPPTVVSLLVKVLMPGDDALKDLNAQKWRRRTRSFDALIRGFRKYKGAPKGYRKEATQFLCREIDGLKPNQAIRLCSLLHH